MDNPVVVEARKYLDTVDYIVDLFDNSFVWGGERLLKVSGYTLEEFLKLRNFDTLDKSVDQNAFRKELSEELAKKHGTNTVLVNTKTGRKINLTLEYHVFEYNGGWYRAAKALNMETMP
jgi:hypothetical protein